MKASKLQISAIAGIVHLLFAKYRTNVLLNEQAIAQLQDIFSKI